MTFLPRLGTGLSIKGPFTVCLYEDLTMFIYKGGGSIWESFYVCLYIKGNVCLCTFSLCCDPVMIFIHLHFQMKKMRTTGVKSVFHLVLNVYEYIIISAQYL